MIESVINLKEEETNSGFPLLVKRNNTSLVVLFTDEKIGTVVSPGGHGKLGETRSDWSDCRDSKNLSWTILKKGESITLTQQ
jgi:hypothetical protein